MSQKTPPEILAVYEMGLGDELGQEFDFCRRQFLGVTYLWDVYLTLFASKERAELLTNTIGNLGGQIANQFLNGVLLGIAKLLDPANQGKFENLTLRRVSAKCPQDLASKTGAMLNDAVGRAEKIRDLRNRVIAHNNLADALGQVDPINPGTRTEITSLLKVLLQFLNLIDNHFLKQATALIPLGNDDARKLLIRLYESQQLRPKIREEHKGQKISLADLMVIPEFLKDDKSQDERYGLKFG